MNPSKQIRCYALSFTDEEFRIIDEMLVGEGYEPDSAGLKKFVLDYANEPEQEPSPYEGAMDRVLGRAGKFIKDNPEVVHRGAEVLKSVFTKKKG